MFKKFWIVFPSVISGIAIVTVCFSPPAKANSPQAAGVHRTVWNGVYTAAQAQRGRSSYMAGCGSCHMEDLSGDGGEAPALRGEAFMERWRDYNLLPLFHLMKTEMPPVRFRTSDTRTPGDEEYVDILTYILQGNGFPPGSSELTLDMLDQVQLVRRDGPRPPPNFALVLSVGCLAETADSRWLLVNATDPIRSTMPDIATADERRASQALPPGPREFRLADFGYLGDGFRPDVYRGHKVQVKGYLIRQPEFERISVTSVATLAPGCP